MGWSVLSWARTIFVTWKRKHELIDSLTRAVVERNQQTRVLHPEEGATKVPLAAAVVQFHGALVRGQTAITGPQRGPVLEPVQLEVFGAFTFAYAVAFLWRCERSYSFEALWLRRAIDFSVLTKKQISSM